jgi:flagellar hook-length control protein FliK
VDIEDLVTSPANDKKLIEGYHLFGSMFSMLEAKLSPDSVLDTKEQLEYKLFESSVSSGSSDFDTAAMVALKTSSEPVVIDLEKARKTVPSYRKVGLKEADLVATQGDGSNTDLMPMQSKTAEAGLNLASSSQGASVTQLHTRLKSGQSDNENAKTDFQAIAEIEKAEVSLNLQLQETSLLRVDQLVRAVVTQSVALSAAPNLGNTLNAHAGLTGQTLRLSLHPAELGGVEVSVSKRGKRLQVTIVADVESTGRLLLKDAEQLIAKLGLVSADTEQVQVHISSNDGLTELRAGEDLLRFSQQSENKRETPNGQYTSSQLMRTKQHERHSSDEKITINRLDNSHRLRGTDEVYI